MGNPKKKKGSSSDSVVSSVPEGQCVFCRSSEENEQKLGKKMSKQGISIHYFCMLFASGLSQRGRGDREGILGFLVPDIIKESRRSGRLRCSYCKKPTATIGCVKANCRACFHFGCGADAGALNQFYGNFSSFCSEHRPLQVVPEQEKKMYRAKYTCCVICMSKVLALPSVDTLRTSCCKANSWYHRECMQRMAMASGLHFCKCPLCNNKDAFQQEMLDFGIYIPDRDAEWELEPNAFQELLERHNQCDHAECRCPRGRTFNEADTGWELVLCDWCGHQGTHVNCGRLASPDQEWVCEECISITNDVNRMAPKRRPLTEEERTAATESQRISYAKIIQTEEGKAMKKAKDDKHNATRKYAGLPEAVKVHQREQRKLWARNKRAEEKAAKLALAERAAREGAAEPGPAPQVPIAVAPPVAAEVAAEAPAAAAAAEAPGRKRTSRSMGPAPAPSSLTTKRRRPAAAAALGAPPLPPAAPAPTPAPVGVGAVRGPAPAAPPCGPAPAGATPPARGAADPQRSQTSTCGQVTYIWTGRALIKRYN